MPHTMLQLVDVSKRYGRVMANDRVSLTIEAGEIVGLLGENGAGKTTLLSIVGGFLRPDSGSILIDGSVVSMDSPRTALRRGIAVVHQHFALVPTFTVQEQLALAGWTSPWRPPALTGTIPLESRIEDLAIGQRQQVEIARALVSNPKILFLDEPTSMLAPGEIDHLFGQLRKIRDAGTSVVLVTHKLQEALDLADRVLVLRAGKLRAEEGRTAGKWREGSRATILAAMFDWNPEPGLTQVAEPVHRSGIDPTDALLSVRNLSTRPVTGRQDLRDVTFTLGAGQRLAILGVNGQGQTELLEALAGYVAHEGDVRLLGRDDRDGDRRAGVGYITADRIGEGGVASLDLTRNLLLKRQRRPSFSRRGILRWSRIRKSAEQTIREWGIQPANGDRPLGTLSGGNIQKLLLAREFARQPQVLVAANPAHGLDSRTAAFLWSRLRSFSEEGNSVIFTTTDLNEATHHADLVAVLFNGRLSDPVPVASVGERELGEMMVAGW